MRDLRRQCAESVANFENSGTRRASCSMGSSPRTIFVMHDNGARPSWSLRTVDWPRAARNSGQSRWTSLRCSTPCATTAATRTRNCTARGPGGIRSSALGKRYESDLKRVLARSDQTHRSRAPKRRERDCAVPRERTSEVPRVAACPITPAAMPPRNSPRPNRATTTA